MGTEPTGISRISKFFADRDHTLQTDALVRRQQYRLTLACGADVAGSYVLQLAVLTAAKIASRCFPGAVTVTMSDNARDAPLLLWPWLGRTFGQELANSIAN